MSILFNQSEDIKVGYFGRFEFLDSQIYHLETFGDDPILFHANPTNQNKNISEKELYAFYEICMLNVFIHIIGTFYVGTDNVDDSRST